MRVKKTDFEAQIQSLIKENRKYEAAFLVAALRARKEANLLRTADDTVSKILQQDCQCT